jgi:hypothetical protein
MAESIIEIKVLSESFNAFKRDFDKSVEGVPAPWGGLAVLVDHGRAPSDEVAGGQPVNVGRRRGGGGGPQAGLSRRQALWP